MAHVVTTKNSHQRTPRVSRDAEYKWPAGAVENNTSGWKPTTTDLWGLAMICVAVVGSLAVVVKYIFS